jgi:hypothetical protein
MVPNRERCHIAAQRQLVSGGTAAAFACSALMLLAVHVSVGFGFAMLCFCHLPF